MITCTFTVVKSRIAEIFFKWITWPLYWSHCVLEPPCIRDTLYWRHSVLELLSQCCLLQVFQQLKFDTIAKCIQDRWHGNPQKNLKLQCNLLTDLQKFNLCSLLKQAWTNGPIVCYLISTFALSKRQLTLSTLVIQSYIYSNWLIEFFF